MKNICGIKKTTRFVKIRGYSKFKKRTESHSILKEKKYSHESSILDTTFSEILVKRESHGLSTFDAKWQENLRIIAKDAVSKQTLTTEKYVKGLNDTLKGFSKRSPQEIRSSKDRRILGLASSEGYWKSLTKKPQHDLEPLKDMFESEIGAFIKSMNTFLYPRSSDLSPQRAYTRFAPWKIHAFLEGFFTILVEKNNMRDLKCFTKISETSLEKIVKQIDSKQLFYDVTRIVMRKVHDNVYNPRDSAKISKASFTVDRSTVFYEYRRVLALYLLNAAITIFIEEDPFKYNDLAKNHSSLLNVFRKFIWGKSHIYENPSNSCWANDHTQLTHIILELYEESGVIQEVARERAKARGKSKTQTRWVLPVSLQPAVTSFTELRRASLPDDVTNESIEDSSAPGLFGENPVWKSGMLKTILNTEQRTRFRVNESYLEILTLLRDISPDSVLGKLISEEGLTLDSPFPPKEKVQLLCGLKDKKLTLQGYVELFRCYYRSASGDYLSDFERYLSTIVLSKRKGKDLLYIYLNKNPVAISGSNAFCYTSHLLTEIYKAGVSGKTAVNVEIDSVPSVLMLMACFFGNRKLAEATNLLGGEFKCPYRTIMEYMAEHYVPRVEHSEKGDYLIKQDRKATKQVTMCFGYAQKTQGRLNYLLERAEEVFPGEIDGVTVAFLKDYAEQFDNHFNEMFPGIVDQIAIIMEAVSIVVNETDSMAVDSLSGMRMTWSRFEQAVEKKRAIHPVTKESLHLSIRVTQYMGDRPKNDLKGHHRQILAYIIHSMDASVKQHFVLEMFNLHKVYIDTLHDCVLVHPNEAQDFYNVAEKLYKSGVLYDSAYLCFFKAVRSLINPDSIYEIERLEKKFYEISDDFRPELININIRAGYQEEN
jgi:hypothetical protein